MSWRFWLLRRVSELIFLPQKRNTDSEIVKWTDVVVEEVRKFVEAQLESFEASTDGYFLWSWAGSFPLTNAGSKHQKLTAG